MSARKQHPDKITVLIVDDHPAIRDGLAHRIAMEPNMEVCGEADTIASALSAVAETAPTVAVIDIALKEASGIDLVQRIKAKHDDVGMLIWTMYGDSHYAERALKAGALGFVTKDEPTAEIISAISRVADGELYLSKHMQDRLLKRTIAGKEGTEAAGGNSLQSLSNRELEVFRLIGQAMDTRSIAASLHLSPKTVETYQARIKEKLSLGSIRELVSCAVRWQGTLPGSA